MSCDDFPIREADIRPGIECVSRRSGHIAEAERRRKAGSSYERAIEGYGLNMDLGLTLIVKGDEDADQYKNKY
jgi:hypothetical protein